VASPKIDRASSNLRRVIRVRGLVKEFRVHTRPAGFGAALRSVFRRRYQVVRAVDNIDFTIERGERVGFLGPNGAGKTTTLKILSGLLHPTAGSAEVDGFEPQLRRREFLRRITLVMGQKNQLIWDLPAVETYELNRAIFGVSRAELEETVAELDALLQIGDLARKPSRQLSLGERMKCELVAALLHRPSTLFLDEPTIGLDVSMQGAIREFVRTYNEHHEATVLLTSHYMEDVVALCPRVIVIHRGQLIYDGALERLAEKIHPRKLISFTLTAEPDRAALERLGEVVTCEGNRAVLRVEREEVRAVVSHALGALPIADMSVEDPPLEDIMRHLFAGAGEVAAEAEAEGRGEGGGDTDAPGPRIASDGG
jgi:ABC-2 type transport system ATP-binding protein